MYTHQETTMIRRLIALLICSFLLVQTSQALSFFDSLYQQDTRNYYKFVSKHVAKLYHQDEDVREKYHEELKTLSGQSKMSGDSFFIYRILTEFVMNTTKPDKTGDMEDIKDLQENTLEFLVDQVNDDDISISSREFIITQLGKIAKSEFLPDFDLNETAVSAIGNMAENDNLILHHTAIVNLKPVAMKWQEKWISLAENAAGHIVEGVSSSNIERRRISLIESIAVLQRAERGTDAIKTIWEGVSGALSDINSPDLQKNIREKVEKLIVANSGQMYKEQVDDAREALGEMEEKRVIAREPLQELITRLSEETDVVEIDGIMTALYKHAKKDRTLFNTIFAQIAGMTLLPEISAYKLRMLNEGLIKLTHLSNSTLYYYRTALILLGEVSVYRSTAHANIPITMLGNLLRSTDYPELVTPVVQEIAISLDSDIPVWIGNRLIGLIFIQAGDSPNEKIALFSTKHLIDIIKDNKRSAFRWEAGVRIKYLTLYATNESVKSYAKNWK